MSEAPIGLKALRERLIHDLACLELPARRWTPVTIDDDVIDVVVIGAGMAGLAAATALRLRGVDVQVFDRAPRGAEGPWRTFARMATLRSPKQLTGPALGLPSLTFRAWYEAGFGSEAWAALDKIPRLMWMDYLDWYRDVMQVPVTNDVALQDITTGPDGLIALSLRGPDGVTVKHARRLVLATGRDGLGGPHLPDFVQNIPQTLWAHSSDAIDFEALRGRRVGVIGAGASAMDNAACALEAGAASLDLFVRRPALPTVNTGKGASGPGAFIGYADLPDALKWRFQQYVGTRQIPPPRDSTLRVSQHVNARLRLASPVEALSLQDDHLSLLTPHGLYDLDFLILATGFRVDLERRLELSRLAPHIRLWGDRFTPEPGLEDHALSGSPDLGHDFAFREKNAGDCPLLPRIHCFNYPATLSLGKLSGDIPGISEGAIRLADAIASSLYNEDGEHHFEALTRYDEPELLGDEWITADD